VRRGRASGGGTFGSYGRGRSEERSRERSFLYAVLSSAPCHSGPMSSTKTPARLDFV
jgi:hypothetical protein